MAYLIEGRIVKIEPTVGNNVTTSSGETRMYLHRKVIIDATKINQQTGMRMFENFPCFDFNGENCAKLDSFQVGQLVTIHFDLKGVRYNDKNTGEEKFFTTLTGFGIGAVDEQPQYQQTPVQSQPISPEYAPNDYNPFYKGNQTVKPQDVQKLYPQPTPQPQQKPLTEEESDLPF